MRRKIVLVLSLSVLLVCLLYVGFNVVEVNAPSGYPVHNLNTGLNYTTIQAAIDAFETLDGHTIHVDAGTYYERVVIDKSLSLIGEDRTTTIIDGNLTGNVIKVTANNVNITGFTTQNSGFHPVNIYSGIYIGEWTTGNNISCNIITNNSCGIYLSRSSGNWVSGNNIIANEMKGIALNGLSNNNSISGNNITNNRCGIYLSLRSSNNIISGNVVIASNVHAIHLYWSSNNIISGNVVTTSGNCGIFLFFRSSSNSISGNNVSNSWRGIRIDSSSNNSISGNNVVDNKYGIFLFDASDNSIFHNNFINNAYQVPSLKSINSWDDGCVGNYWSDYDGMDSDGDGIVDTPYVIDENNQDNYPLMTPITPLYFTLLSNYTELQASYDSLQTSYNNLQTDFDSLNSTYTQLQQKYDILNSSYTLLEDSYDELQSDKEVITNELGTIKNLMYVLIVTTIVLTATTVYFAIRKPKTEQ